MVFILNYWEKREMYWYKFIFKCIVFFKSIFGNNNIMDNIFYEEQFWVKNFEKKFLYCIFILWIKRFYDGYKKNFEYYEM